MALFLACLSALAVVNAIPAIFPSDEVTPAITDALVTFVNVIKILLFHRILITFIRRRSQLGKLLFLPSLAMQQLLK